MGSLDRISKVPKRAPKIDKDKADYIYKYVQSLVFIASADYLSENPESLPRNFSTEVSKPTICAFKHKTRNGTKIGFRLILPVFETALPQKFWDWTYKNLCNTVRQLGEEIGHESPHG